MVAYKNRYTQFVITAQKQPIFTLQGDTIVFNLNSCFIRYNNFSRFLNSVGEASEFGNKINLCNLASLCYKLKMPYTSDDTLIFVSKLIDLLKSEFPNLDLVQNGLYNFGEVDMQPIADPITYDPFGKIVYVNSIITETLKKLGYVDAQFYNTLDYCIDLRQIIPSDLLLTIPINTDKNMAQYTKILSLIKESYDLGVCNIR